jgi:hypothetical protein
VFSIPLREDNTHKLGSSTIKTRWKAKIVATKLIHMSPLAIVKEGNIRYDKAKRICK